jgi:hypothetical protein
MEGLMSILEADRQAQWDERALQGGKRRYRSQWVIAALADYLSPEHVAMAERWVRLQGIVEGCRVMSAKVDHGNRAELAMAARMDAQRTLAGLEEAARTRVGKGGAGCFWSVAYGDKLETLMRRCGFPRGSSRGARRLVQLTLHQLDEYEAELERSARAPKPRSR